MKTCTKCNLEKSINEFRKAKGYKNGIQSRCKSCENKSQKENCNFKKNQQKYRKKKAEQRKEYNRELCKKIKLLEKPILTEKKCANCNIIKPIINFTPNPIVKCGYNYSCIECKKEQRKQVYERSDKKLKCFHAANRRAKVRQRTPAWANKELIKEIYKNCPEGYEVDHIVPISGIEVCGFHVEYNLQYLTKFENRKKRNKLESK